MYQITKAEDKWLVVIKAGDKRVLVYEATTHAEALNVRQALLNAPPPDDYDNYIDFYI